MATFLTVPPQTPSPKVRIRPQSFSFDSPSSITRLTATTPIEEYPFSKSTGAINVTRAVPQHHVLLPLRTKMSEESLSDSSSSAMSISPASSPTASCHGLSLRDLPEGNLLGLFEHATFEEDTISVAPGDILITFSDGVTEALSATGEEYGEERLLACVQASRDQPTPELLEAVLASVRAFTAGAGPQTQDVALTIQGHADGGVDRPVGDLAVADLDDDGVDEDRRVDLIERPD